MNPPTTPPTFPHFAAQVAVVLAQASVPLADYRNQHTAGTRAYVLSGYGDDPQNRLCTLVYRSTLDLHTSVSTIDAPLEYKTILEHAGYTVQADQTGQGEAIWRVYPPA